MQEITLISGNRAKIINTTNKLKPFNIKVNNIKMETIEIQADTAEEIAAYSAKYASEVLKRDVLKNDCGLYVKALKGFPGPYTHYCDDTITEDGLLKLMEGIKDRTAEFREALAYCKYGEEPVVFSSVTKGRIALKKSGKYGYSWDFIFIPQGKRKTLGNYDDKERFELWDDSAYKKLGEYLTNMNK